MHLRQSHVSIKIGDFALLVALLSWGPTERQQTIDCLNGFCPSMSTLHAYPTGRQSSCEQMQGTNHLQGDCLTDQQLNICQNYGHPSNCMNMLVVHQEM